LGRGGRVGNGGKKKDWEKKKGRVGRRSYEIQIENLVFVY